MVFQYTPATTRPPNFRGVDGTGLANIIRGQNSGLASGIQHAGSVMFQALSAMQAKKKKQEQQDFLADMGEEIAGMTETITEPNYMSLPQWQRMGEKELKESRVTIDDEGNEKITQHLVREGGEQWYEGRVAGINMTPAQKEGMRSVLMDATPRNMVNEQKFMNLRARAYKLGISPGDFRTAAEGYVGQASIGRQDYTRDVQRQMSEAGFGRIDFDVQHPVTQELIHAATESGKEKAVMDHLFTKYGVQGWEAGNMVGQVRKILESGATMRSADEQIASLMGSRQSRQQVVQSPMAPPQGGFYTFEGPDAAKKVMNLFGGVKGEEANELSARLQLNGKKPITVNADGTWESNDPELSRLLGKAMENKSPEQRASMLSHLNFSGDQMTTKGYTGPPAGVGGPGPGPSPGPGPGPGPGPNFPGNQPGTDTTPEPVEDPDIAPWQPYVTEIDGNKPQPAPAAEVHEKARAQGLNNPPIDQGVLDRRAVMTRDWRKDQGLMAQLTTQPQLAPQQQEFAQQPADNRGQPAGRQMFDDRGPRMAQQPTSGLPPGGMGKLLQTPSWDVGETLRNTWRAIDQNMKGRETRRREKRELDDFYSTPRPAPSEPNANQRAYMEKAMSDIWAYHGGMQQGRGPSEHELQTVKAAASKELRDAQKELRSAEFGEGRTKVRRARGGMGGLRNTLGDLGVDRYGTNLKAAKERVKNAKDIVQQLKKALSTTRIGADKPGKKWGKRKHKTVEDILNGFIPF